MIDAVDDGKRLSVGARVHLYAVIWRERLAVDRKPDLAITVEAIHFPKDIGEVSLEPTASRHEVVERGIRWKRH